MTGRSHLFSNALALTSVLLLASLLHSAQGTECLKADGGRQVCAKGDPDAVPPTTKEEWCIKWWKKEGETDIEYPNGCIGDLLFKTQTGFEPSAGKCGPVTADDFKDKYSYACACTAVDVGSCNHESFGDKEYQADMDKGGEATTTTTKATGDDGKDGGSSGLVLSPLLPLTLAALTLGALLAC